MSERYVVHMFMSIAMDPLHLLHAIYIQNPAAKNLLGKLYRSGAQEM
jgi:hypothetical protein